MNIVREDDVGEISDMVGNEEDTTDIRNDKKTGEVLGLKLMKPCAFASKWQFSTREIGQENCMDTKDILGLPKTQLPIPQEKKSRPQKDPQRKPDGILREVYALTGGLAPLMPAVDVSQLKKRPPSDEKITWQWLPFINSTRKDDLQLFHWVRVVNAVPPSGDYAFAKYNKFVNIMKYTDEEYEKYLADPVWTKEETDQLMDLCERFDLRFIVIADRFPSSHSVEELKDRYYSVSRALLIARAPTPTEVTGRPLLKELYNITQEIKRKQALSMVLSQTKHQE